jgi:hypothetical protein
MFRAKYPFMLFVGICPAFTRWRGMAPAVLPLITKNLTAASFALHLSDLCIFKGLFFRAEIVEPLARASLT